MATVAAALAGVNAQRRRARQDYGGQSLRDDRAADFDAAWLRQLRERGELEARERRRHSDAAISALRSGEVLALSSRNAGANGRFNRGDVGMARFTRPGWVEVVWPDGSQTRTQWPNVSWYAGEPLPLSDVEQEAPSAVVVSSNRAEGHLNSVAIGAADASSWSDDTIAYDGQSVSSRGIPTECSSLASPTPVALLGSEVHSSRRSPHEQSSITAGGYPQRRSLTLNV
eukprot:TRINITY_DN1021_c1_g1_i1.p1 TRINITY_DN1021_c1_g1~~TRINITY_DN1021_c1_g1_i1.p1  ORF type:complete len:248 (-),score=35.50 TRINITY_DN1021_c1_g1_i1:293-976(-)